MKIQKLDEFFGKQRLGHLSGNTINVNLDGNTMDAGGNKLLDLAGVASGIDVGAQVNPQLSSDGAAVGVGGSNPRAGLPEDVNIGHEQEMNKKSSSDSSNKESDRDSIEGKHPDILDNILTEGRLGELAFGNSLAMSLYQEFYSELQKAIDDKDKREAQSILNDFEQDLRALKRQNRRWHKTFIEIQEKLLADYQDQIDALPDPEDATHGANVTEDIDKEFDDNYTAAGWDEYDDDYYDLDDVELDRRHAALYGGDRMYCDCGTKRVADEDGYFYCPECDKYE